MSTKQDYYEILAIAKNASGDEIKKAYRNLALKHHPDRDKTQGAAERFKEVNEAYEVLSDPQKRSAYDQFGHAAFDQGGMGAQGPFGSSGQQGADRQGPFSYTFYTSGDQTPFEADLSGFSDPFEIFQQFFGGSPFTSSRRSKRHSAYSISVDFIESIKGVQKEIEVEGKRMNVKIPAGVEDGSRIRFDSFDLVVAVRPDKVFKREGNDIFVDKEITFAQAVLGEIVEVPTVDGHLKLRVQPGTKPGTMIRLKEKGSPDVRGRTRGDQYVRINIKVPDRLTQKQKELLREFDEEGKVKKSWF